MSASVQNAQGCRKREALMQQASAWLTFLPLSCTTPHTILTSNHITVRACIHTCSSTHARTHAYTRAAAHTHARMHTQLHTCSSTHAHTHAQHANTHAQPDRQTDRQTRKLTNYARICTGRQAGRKAGRHTHLPCKGTWVHGLSKENLTHLLCSGLGRLLRQPCTFQCI